MNDQTKVIPAKIKEGYTSLLKPEHSLKEDLVSFCEQPVSCSLRIYNDELLGFIYDNLNKNIEYIFDYYMEFSHLKKIKVNQNVYNKLVDMYAYDVRSLSPTHVFFVEGDCRFDSGYDIDYSNFSYEELVLKLAEDLLFIYG